MDIPLVDDGLLQTRNILQDYIAKAGYANEIFLNLTLLTMLMKPIEKDTNIIKLDPIELIKNDYDYIIVGGGSAGCVMAARLSENPCVTVLLLEAGSKPLPITEVPGFTRLIQDNPIAFWSDESTPQKYGACGHKRRVVPMSSAKVLGGGSTVNYMLYVRGSSKVYDAWEASGASGWSYRDVLPYFLLSEGNQDTEGLDPGYHNTTGPLTVENICYNPEIKEPIIQAAKALNFSVVDINGKQQTGVTRLQVTCRNQQRCSTAKAYLYPARHRPNLHILTNAYVRKILISKNAKTGENRAHGVEYDHLGLIRTVKALKEVIICAGSIRTPQILMLSGIGPEEELHKFKIPVIADLPVGKNLQDHNGIPLIYEVKSTIPSIIFKILDPIQILNYTLNKCGPLSSPGQISLGAFFEGFTPISKAINWPNLALYIAEYVTADVLLHLNFKDEIFSKVFAPYTLKPTFLCAPSLMHPHSRGEITLRSTDPHDKPLINPNYLQNKTDVETLLEGIKICEAIAKQPAMREVQAKLIATQRSNFPGCEMHNGDEDAYFTCMIKQIMMTIWHYSGTAKMGRIDDPTTVVDPQLRVKGVGGLRVVGAAIMPIIPSGNTNAPTIMVAERAYGLMKKDIVCC